MGENTTFDYVSCCATVFSLFSVETQEQEDVPDHI